MAEREKQEAFGSRMVDILNYGALNLAMAVGYRTGLFETMASFSLPRSSAAIAVRAGLNERYVREWLGVMFTGDVVELVIGEDGIERYLLPPEHAAFLVRSAGNANLAVYTQEMPLLTACAMEPVIRAFQTGEGVPYRVYPRFQSFMSELANAKHRQVLMETFLPSVADGRLLERLNRGIRVCDFGCGEGVAMLLMARAFPRSRFTGIDSDAEAIETARSGAATLGLKNADTCLKDAATLKDDIRWRETFDYVVAFDAIHDQSKPLEALQSVYHLLTDGGMFSMVDIAAHTRHNDNRSHPMGPFLYAVSLMHCLPVGLVNGGAGLGMMWGQELATDMLHRAGFAVVQVHEIPEDPFNLHFFCQKIV
ncbi:MAG: class I SAM-dependent methyltransferase [Deltaproteobacteria bacterium]|nr:class I SAM-dependent methyltransferase [Deltaproteobacteria bacterium]